MNGTFQSPLPKKEEEKVKIERKKNNVKAAHTKYNIQLRLLQQLNESMRNRLWVIIHNDHTIK